MLEKNKPPGGLNRGFTVGLISKTTILHVHHAFFTFLCRHCTTTTWKCLVSRWTEEVHKRRRNFLSLSELGYDSLEFNFRRVRLHLTKLVTWSNRDENWKNANSLFQRRFLCRLRPRILRSLMLKSGLFIYSQSDKRILLQLWPQLFKWRITPSTE